MTDDREAQVVTALVAVATSLTRGRDLVDLFTEMTADCAALLDVDGSCLLLAGRDGTLQVAAASGERAHLLARIQVKDGAGPCVDAFSDGAHVSVDDIDQARARWPEFVGSASRVGVRAVHAMPLRSREHTYGSLGLLNVAPGPLAVRDLLLGQAFVEILSAALVSQWAVDDRDIVVQQLQSALDRRVVIEQAKGRLAERGQVEMEEAFATLRRFARDHNIKIVDVATNIVSGDLTVDAVLEHVPG